MVKKTREFHDNRSENISDESIGGAALIRVNTVNEEFFLFVSRHKHYSFNIQRAIRLKASTIFLP